ncbi:hypothetical protein BHE90_014911 [Fusarium euwallaceae]|uniref:Gfd2/YDR514C-like C-terminal domain-containing protein n=3 Tax=Fusarium solani species complex TaxID=232080 RepID=A0A3M2S903_9HYPO|nr:hypothetical protein CDV36_006267 [Fusarium kuroshium]RSL70080.1 hypothetical protein CEP51_012255 [Fusarium floridanum]RTE70688.1 hypothetical protein BHE90_014911 [Fusarium euwallaceae]
MFTRPRLPRGNTLCQCQFKFPSVLAWPRFKTTTTKGPKRLPKRRRETDEPAILAWLLGYSDQAQQPSGAPWPDLPKLVSKKANATIRRVRFVSIDIDGLHQDKAGIRQFDFGVSVLDTVMIHRQLKRPLDPKINLATQLIKSSHYLVEDAEYGVGRRTRFAFGSCRVSSLTKLKQRLKKETKNHNVVLIMHGAATEVSVMKRLCIELNPVFTIDTTTAVQHLFRKRNLRWLLKEYKIPHETMRLHYAGNDAHYILRVLLMIAARHAKTKPSGREPPDWVPVFEAVARSPRPEPEALRKCGPLRITPGNKERKQMERRREILERIEKRIGEPSRIKRDREMVGLKGCRQRFPNCDAMSPSWADRYTISQYGMLP